MLKFNSRLILSSIVVRIGRGWESDWGCLLHRISISVREKYVSHKNGVVLFCFFIKYANNVPIYLLICLVSVVQANFYWRQTHQNFGNESLIFVIFCYHVLRSESVCCFFVFTVMQWQKTKSRKMPLWPSSCFSPKKSWRFPPEAFDVCIRNDVPI